MKYEKFIPAIYKKNIFEINYDSLFQKGIKCLLIDFDNTITTIDSKEVNAKTVELFKEMSKHFRMIIISNNFKKRIAPVSKILNVEYISFALKPLGFQFKKVMKKYGYHHNELCLIGDQLISDIFGGNRMKILTILVDPLNKKDLKITKLNRYLELKILNKLGKEQKLKRGNYYE